MNRKDGSGWNINRSKTAGLGRAAEINAKRQGGKKTTNKTYSPDTTDPGSEKANLTNPSDSTTAAAETAAATA